jgi:hypothetical protein
MTLSEKLDAAMRIIAALAENDPDEPIADNGMRVVDGLRVDAVHLISRLQMRNLGRPRIEDAANSFEATKPWLALGWSRSTWYRRQAEKRKKAL